MTIEPGILASGPWRLEHVQAHWRADAYAPAQEVVDAADEAIVALRDRDSPAHDGVAARLVSFSANPHALVMNLQPIRWALRLIPDDAQRSIAALCVTRRADGAWLAGRRAPWVSTWAGRWALGAGGAVDVNENPADTLARELREEWSVEAERVRGEALVCLPHRLIMFVGTAWLPDGAEVMPDSEHDAHAWWPADVRRWPDDADEPLRRMGALLAQAGTEAV